MTREHESRPQAAIPGAAKSFAGDSHQYSGPTDIVALDAAEWDRAMEFYASGYTAGVEAGRQLADEEAAALGREAARIVHYMAGVPPRDSGEDRARRARIDARFGGGQ